MPSHSDRAKSKRPMLQMPREAAQNALQIQIQKGHELLNIVIQNEPILAEASRQEEKWSSYNYRLLKQIVDTDEFAEEYYPSAFYIPSYTPPLSERVAKFKEETTSRINYLESVIEQLDLIQEAPNLVRPTSAGISLKQSDSGVRVFVVHGHDNEAKTSVARFIEKLGLNVIILHEQPNRGKTIMEKFENNANESNFAVVLLTPDDIGASAKTPKNLQPRARQNVIAELGYFSAKLGRDRVCALHKGNLELPSDFDGVLWIAMDDAGAWKTELARELNAAGIAFDAKKIF